jgi:hypothetical protein
MQPSSLLSYYPTYSILDEARSLVGNPTNVNFFIDLKNVLRGIYMKFAVENIVESTRSAKYVDSSIFASVPSFLSFHKMWAYKRGVNANFFIFFESGHSVYHLNIDKSYKCSRKIASVYGVDVSYQEEFFAILHSNLQLIEKACNGFPNVYVLRLHNLECDFLPYYLLTRGKFGKNPDQLNMLYSNDKDMWQTISNNTFIFSKTGKVKKLLVPGDLVSKFLKRPCSIDDSYFPLVKAIWGDPGDDIDGVEGVGPAGIADFFPTFQTMIGSMDDIYDNIQNRLPILNVIPSKIENKKLKSVVDAELNTGLITKNLKLISFELLSRALDDPIESKMNERKAHLAKIVNDKEIIKLGVMTDTLKKFNITIEEDALNSIYHL